MHIVKKLEIELSTYHGEIVGRVWYVKNDQSVDCSNLYSLPELNNIVSLFKMGELMGSFGIGHKLANDADIVFYSRG
ncbi:MAG: hypothetical protein KGZ81_13860 [Flavobacteriales bacterium]|nr:hypothetical protein [Flavobacteriales bacterium]